MQTNVQFHRHVCCSSLNVTPELAVYVRHTQPNPNCEYLSLFQGGEQTGGFDCAQPQMNVWDLDDRERSNPFCHHTARSGRKHTGRNRKLDISDGLINILQCNVTNWSEHARHFILTSDFYAALISETHLEEAKLTAAVKEANKSAWACTGSAAMSTVNKGTSVEVLALVRNRWCSKPLSICTDEAGVLSPNSRLAERVIRVMGKEILLLTAYFEHSVGLRTETIANLMDDVCFLT